MLIQLAQLDSVGYQFLFPIGSTKELKFRDIAFRGSLSKISKNVIKEGGKDEN